MNNPQITQIYADYYSFLCYFLRPLRLCVEFFSAEQPQ